MHSLLVLHFWKTDRGCQLRALASLVCQNLQVEEAADYMKAEGEGSGLSCQGGVCKKGGAGY